MQPRSIHYSSCSPSCSLRVAAHLTRLSTLPEHASHDLAHYPHLCAPPHSRAAWVHHGLRIGKSWIGEGLRSLIPMASARHSRTGVRVDNDGNAWGMVVHIIRWLLLSRWQRSEVALDVVLHNPHTDEPRRTQRFTSCFNFPGLVLEHEQ